MTQACAACKHQRKRCTPECALAPHFRPEHPAVFKNAHKLFGVKNILRILEQIKPYQKPEAMRSIIYEANMRDQFPVHGCLGVIYELGHQIRQAEDELCGVLTRLAFYKQQQQVSPFAIQPDTDNMTNAFWVQQKHPQVPVTEEELYLDDSKDENESRVGVSLREW